MAAQPQHYVKAVPCANSTPDAFTKIASGLKSLVVACSGGALKTLSAVTPEAIE